MPKSTTAKLAKNITTTVKLTGQASSTFLTVITNPYFLIGVAILFFPLHIFNYLILFTGNLVIMLGNVLIFVVQAILTFLLNMIIFLINVPINIINGVSFGFEIPMPDPFDDIDINFDLPDIGELNFLTFPGFGTIDYLSIGDTTFLPSKVLLLWIFELLGFSLL